MAARPTPYAVALVASVALSLTVAAVALRRRETRGAVPLAAMTLSTAGWSAASLWVFYTAGGASLVGLRLIYLGVVCLVASWFVFAVEYSGNEEYLDRRVLGALAVEPVLLQALVWTNGSHGLFWRSVDLGGRLARPETQNGVAFFAHTVYSYVLLGAGVVLLARMVVRQRDLYRFQVAAVVAAVLVPWAANAAVFFGPLENDYTSVAFALSGAALTVAVFRYEFVDVAPVARDTVVDNIRDGVIVLDDRDRVVDINRMGRRVLGVEGESVIGEPMAAVMADYPDVWAYFEDATERREEVPIEIEGDRRVFDVRVSPLTDERGDRAGRLFRVHDVTERERRERELRRRNEHLDGFASLVSHDLRNPLNVADGYVETAIEEGEVDYVEEIERSHERMEELIDDVLTLAREGKRVEETTAVDLAEVAREAWRNVDTGGATLEVRFDHAVEADPGRLKRALENLFRNAVEHGSTSPRPGDEDAVEHGSTRPPTGSEDAVEHGSTSPRPEDEDAVEHGGPDVAVGVGPIGDFEADAVVDGRRGFWVADDGPGIPPEERDRVFEQGFTTEGDGTGLGLAIVQSVVEAHGWSIDVTESPAGGARFEVTGVSPARRPEEPAPDPGD